MSGMERIHSVQPIHKVFIVFMCIPHKLLIFQVLTAHEDHTSLYLSVKHVIVRSRVGRRLHYLSFSVRYLAHLLKLVADLLAFSSAAFSGP